MRPKIIDRNLITILTPLSSLSMNKRHLPLLLAFLSLSPVRLLRIDSRPSIFPSMQKWQKSRSSLEVFLPDLRPRSPWANRSAACSRPIIALLALILLFLLLKYYSSFIRVIIVHLCLHDLLFLFSFSTTSPAPPPLFPPPPSTSSHPCNQHGRSSLRRLFLLLRPSFNLHPKPGTPPATPECHR